MVVVTREDRFASIGDAAGDLVFEIVARERGVEEVRGTVGEHVGGDHPQALGIEAETHRGSIDFGANRSSDHGPHRAAMGVFPVIAFHREGEPALHLGVAIPGVEHPVPPAEFGVRGVDDAVVVSIGIRIVQEVGELVVDPLELRGGPAGKLGVVDHASVLVEIERIEEEIEVVDEFVSIEVDEFRSEVLAFDRMSGSKASIVVDVVGGQQFLEEIEFEVEIGGEPADVASHVERIAGSAVELPGVLAVAGPERAEDHHVLADHDSVGTDHRVFDSFIEFDLHREDATHLAVDAFAHHPNRVLTRNRLVSKSKPGGSRVGRHPDGAHVENAVVFVEGG